MGRTTLQAPLFFNELSAEAILGATIKYIVEATKEDFENFESRIFPVKGGYRLFFDFSNKKKVDDKWIVKCALRLGKEAITYNAIIDSKDNSVTLVSPDTETPAEGFTIKDTKLAHQIYHEVGAFSAVIKNIADSLGIVPADGEYDFRSFLEKQPNEQYVLTHDDSTGTILRIEEDGILTIIDPRFKKDHAGRTRNAAYAKNEAKAQHELTELRAWRAKEEELIGSGVIGDGKKYPSIKAWMQASENKEEAKTLNREFHAQAVAIEREIAQEEGLSVEPTGSEIKVTPAIIADDFDITISSDEDRKDRALALLRESAESDAALERLIAKLLNVDVSRRGGWYEERATMDVLEIRVKTDPNDKKAISALQDVVRAGHLNEIIRMEVLDALRVQPAALGELTEEITHIAEETDSTDVEWACFEALKFLVEKGHVPAVYAIRDLILSHKINKERTKVYSGDAGMAPFLCRTAIGENGIIDGKIRKAARQAAREILVKNPTDREIILYLCSIVNVAVEEDPEVFVSPGVMGPLTSINEKAEVSKRILGLASFWGKYWYLIARLETLDKQYCEKIIREIAEGLGPCRVKAFFQDIEGTLRDDVMHANLSKIFKKATPRDKTYAQRILEIAEAYRSMQLKGLFARLSNEIDEGERISIEDAYLMLAENLLKEFAKKMGVPEAKITSESIDRWDLLRLSKLFVAKRMFAEPNRYYESQILEGIITATLEDKFSEFIIDASSDNKYTMGRQIAIQNERVREHLEELGIDVEKWLGYSETSSFNFAEGKDQEVDVRAMVGKVKDQLEELFSVMRKEDRNGIKDRLKKLGWTNKKREITILKETGDSNGERDRKLSEALKKFFNEYFGKFKETLTKYLTVKYKGIESDEAEGSDAYRKAGAVLTAIPHVMVSVENLRKQVEDPKKLQERLKKARSFVVKTWARNPGRDIFQGNFTACCVAINSPEHPEGILEYLIDQGVQVVEVVDEVSGNTIAQTWVFVAYDMEDEPVLVMDNIEVHNSYPLGTKQNKIIADNIIEYVKGYAKDVGAKAVYLGETEYNDIITTNMEIDPLTLRKAGGYLWDQMEGYEEYGYYLEAMFGQVAGPYTVYEDGTIPSITEGFYVISSEEEMAAEVAEEDLALSEEEEKEELVLSEEYAKSRVIALEDQVGNGVDYQGVILYAEKGTAYVLSAGHDAEGVEEVVGKFGQTSLVGEIVAYQDDDDGRDLAVIRMTGLPEDMNLPMLDIGYPPLGDQFEAEVAFVNYESDDFNLDRIQENTHVVSRDAESYTFEGEELNAIYIDTEDSDLDQWGICGAPVFYTDTSGYIKLVGIINAGSEKEHEDFCCAATGHQILTFLNKIGFYADEGVFAQDDAASLDTSLHGPGAQTYIEDADNDLRAARRLFSEGRPAEAKTLVERAIDAYNVICERRKDEEDEDTVGGEMVRAAKRNIEIAEELLDEIDSIVAAHINTIKPALMVSAKPLKSETKVLKLALNQGITKFNTLENSAAAALSLKKWAAPQMSLKEYAVKRAWWLEETIFFLAPMLLSYFTVGLTSIWFPVIMAGVRGIFYSLHKGARSHAPPLAPLKVSIFATILTILPVILPSLAASPAAFISASTILMFLFHLKENIYAVNKGLAPATIPSDDGRITPEYTQEVLQKVKDGDIESIRALREIFDANDNRNTNRHGNNKYNNFAEGTRQTTGLLVDMANFLTADDGPKGEARKELLEVLAGIFLGMTKESNENYLYHLDFSRIEDHRKGPLVYMYGYLKKIALEGSDESSRAIDILKEKFYQEDVPFRDKIIQEVWGVLARAKIKSVKAVGILQGIVRGQNINEDLRLLAAQKLLLENREPLVEDLKELAINAAGSETKKSFREMVIELAGRGHIESIRALREIFDANDNRNENRHGNNKYNNFAEGTRQTAGLL
ncbi:hypothetical protein ACFL5E_03860, partial [Candidatus Omnitrophota bacterium]